MTETEMKKLKKGTIVSNIFTGEKYEFDRLERAGNGTLNAACWRLNDDRLFWFTAENIKKG
jgi:hypothetical protein